MMGILRLVSCVIGLVVASSATDELCHFQADIIFLLDSSGSLGTADYGKLLDFAARMAQHFYISPSEVEIGAVVFGTEAVKVFDLKDFPDVKSVTEALRSIPFHRSVGTYTHRALDLVVDENLFGQEAGGRDDAEDVVIILTDGASSIPEKTEAAAERLKGVADHVISIGIGDAISVPELETMASSDSDAFTIDNFDDLADLESVIAAHTCTELEKRALRRK